jgi:Uma2 family endonuclease
MIEEMIAETISKKLFTIDEFYRLSEMGILPDDQRFELIRGEIVEMPTPESLHSGRVDRLNRVLSRGCRNPHTSAYKIPCRSTGIRAVSRPCCLA